MGFLPGHHIGIDLALKIDDLSRDILKLRQQGLQIEKKSDNSSVTNADFYSHHALCEILKKIDPTLPIISEESDNLIPRPEYRQYWCIDPIDSTSDYINGGAHFSINIALIENGVAKFGMLAFPALAKTYWGERGAGAKIWQNGSHSPIFCRTENSSWDILISSKSHAHPERIGKWTQSIPIQSIKRLNGSIKFALIADGTANLYPRFTQLSEWDIAAGDAVISAAGGRVTDINGTAINYGANPDYLCPYFIARAF